MSTPRLPEWLVPLVIVVALPAVGCFGYYSAGDLSASNRAWGTLMALAFPLALIGVAGMGVALRSPPRTRVRLWGWGVLVLASLGLLLAARSVL